MFFALHYVKSAKYYGEFTLSLFDREGTNITQKFEFYGVSYFGDTITLYPEKLEYKNKSQVYLKSLIVNSLYADDSIEINLQDDSLNSAFQGFNKGNNIIQLSCNENIIDKIVSIKNFRYLFVLIFVSLLISVLFLIFDKEIFKLLNKKIIKYFLLLLLVLIIVVAIVLFVRKFKNAQPDLVYYPDFCYETIINYSLKDPVSGLKIEIKDTSNSRLEFIFSLNDKFWFNESDFKRNLFLMDVDSAYKTPGEIIKAFKLVSNYTYHKCPHEKIQKAEVLNNPYLLLNSIGGGLCNNRAVAISVLSNSLGYNSRLISVNGHAFAEVFNKNKWIMLDPDYGLFFVNSIHNIASIKQVRSDSVIIPQVLNNKIFINNLENYYNPFPERLKDLYLSETQYCNSCNTKLSNLDSYFSLPAQSVVSFPIYCDSIGSYLMRIKISGDYFGKVRIPLLIHSINGNNLFNYYYLDSNLFLYDEFFISGKNIEILAFINPLLFIPDEDGIFDFTYFSSEKTKPKIEIFEKTDTLNYFTSIPKIMQLFNEVKLNYYEIACEYLIDKNNEILEWRDLEKLICDYIPEFEDNSTLNHQLRSFFNEEVDRNPYFLDIINEPGIVAVVLFISDFEKCNYDYRLLFRLIRDLSEHKPI